MQNRAALILGSLKTRDSENAPVIEGYFAKFGTETELWPGSFEEIAPGAFEIDGEDIRAIVNHNTTLVLGRTAASTLTLTLDEVGLYGVITINPADVDAMNLYERVKRGDVTQCSFGFDPVEQDVDYNEDGTVKYTLRKVKLWEVSVCTFPAYEDTGVSVRQKQEADHRRAKIEARKKKYKKERFMKRWHLKQ